MITGTDPTNPWGVADPSGDMATREWGKVSLFTMYLYENFGGVNFLKTLIAEDKRNIEGIDAAIAKSNVDYNHTDFYQVFKDFMVACTIHDTLGQRATNSPYSVENPGPLYGFNYEAYKTALDGKEELNLGSSKYDLGIFYAPMFPQTSHREIASTCTGALNNWAVDVRVFFAVNRSTTQPAEQYYWASGYGVDSSYVFHFNCMDNGAIEMQLLKGKFNATRNRIDWTVEDLTGKLNDQKEYVLNILKDGYKSTTTEHEFEYDALALIITQQDTIITQGMDFVYSTDDIKPELSMSHYQNPFFPEYVNFYIFSNKHLYTDVNSGEIPVMRQIMDGDTTDLSFVLFDKDISDSIAAIYTLEHLFYESGTAQFTMPTTQDISGNNISFDPPDMPVSFVMPYQSSIIASADGKAIVDLPMGAVNRRLPILTSSHKNGDVPFLCVPKADKEHNSVGLAYRIGPNGYALQKSAILTLSIQNASNSDLGIYRLANNNWEYVGGEVNKIHKTITTSITQFGIYQVQSGPHYTIENNIPITFDLCQNFPNPFNPNTNIKYQIPKSAYVSLKVYNVKGELVRTLVEDNQEAAYYNINWNGTDEIGKSVPSGVYFYSLQTNDYNFTRKMLLLK